MNSYLLNRPVNALKKIYAPAYLGAKIRASKANDSVNKIQELAIKKRLHSSSSWNYRILKVFKGLNETQLPEYRDYLVPSPSTSTAEAYILNNLGQDLGGARTSNVYSYIKAPRGAQHNYEYYLPHYLQRNQGILNALEAGKGVGALFLDLKNFYGSVDKERLISAVKAHHSFTSKSNLFAVDFLIDQINQSPSGIPIGTELSHFLGDIYLSSIDADLKDLLGNNYFRYVDDITVVSEIGKLETLEKDIRSRVEALGLKLNDSKREVFSEAEWLGEMDTSPVEGDDFYDYCQMLGRWIGGDPNRMKWLQSELQNEGFQIPLRKIFSSPKRISVPDQSQHEVVRTSLDMRAKYLHAVKQVTEQLSKNSSRWYLQKTKRAINPLFYLLNKEQYGTITSAARESSKLKTQEEVSTAFLDNSCESIIKYPGVTISTFCEIWKTVQPSGHKLADMEAREPTPPEQESLTTLALYGIVAPQKQVAESSIWQALRPGVQHRTTALDGFDAEIESLRIGITEEEQRTLLDNRLTLDEDMFLSGLELGNQSISP